MRKFKIPSPKLRHTLLCRAMLYAPCFLWFILLLITAIFEDELNAVLSDGTLAVLIGASMLLSLIYIFYSPMRFIAIDITLEGIRLHMKDRLFFQTDKNGRTKSDAEHTIMRRMSHIGYTCVPNKASPAPLLIKFYSAFSWTYFYARIEKICLLYSAGHLDTALYNRIITSASSNILPLHGDKSKMRFFDKQKKKAPLASAAALIILADSIDENIPRAVRRNIGSYKENVILPCVADISSGKYYFDSLMDMHIMGISGKPIKNYAIDIIKKVVFGGRLPLRGNDNFTIPQKNLDMDMTLHEAMREFHAEEGKIPLICKLAARKIKPGQFKFRGDYIICKIRKKAMAFRYALDKERSGHIIVYLHKKSVNFPERNLSNKELEFLSAELKQFIENENFTCEFVKGK